MDKLPSRVFSHRKLLSFSILAGRYPLTCYMQWLTKLRPKGPEKNFETGAPLISGSGWPSPPPPPPPFPLPEGLDLSLTGPLRDLAIDIWASELWKFLTQQENPLVPEPNGTFFDPCNPMFWQFTRCLYSQELEDTIESLRQQISVLQSRARVLQEELDSGNRLSSSFSISAVRDQDELWSNWRKKITSNKYITEWSAGFLSSSTQHYCLIFESEKYIYI